jgi:hypothetical protein
MAIVTSRCCSSLAWMLLIIPWHIEADSITDDPQIVTDRLIGSWYSNSYTRGAGVDYETHVLTVREPDGKWVRLVRRFNHGALESEYRSTGKWEVKQNVLRERIDKPPEGQQIDTEFQIRELSPTCLVLSAHPKRRGAYVIGPPPQRRVEPSFQLPAVVGSMRSNPTVERDAPPCGVRPSP